MKLLFDQNLSYRIPAAISQWFPGSTHVRDLGLDRADDETVWAFARNHGFTIVSKDDDFHQRSFLYGPPPKVVGLHLGNCSTARVIECLRGHVQVIRDFEADPQAAFLALS